MVCYFLLHSKVNGLFVDIYALFFRFFPHVGYYGVLSRIPWAVQHTLVSYLFYID